MQRGFKSWAERQAIEQRYNLDLREDAPLPAAQLAANRGVTILGPGQIPGMSLEDLECLLQYDSSSWSAVTVIAGKCMMVIHNTSHALVRQESNIMHEMAHIICKHVPVKLIQIGGLPFFFREYDAEQEEEANWLGACLQLPRPALCMAVRQRMTMPEMSRYFQASEEMVRYRRQITGVDRQFSRLGIK
jgi:hypothetical protein